MNDKNQNIKSEKNGRTTYICLNKRFPICKRSVFKKLIKSQNFVLLILTIISLVIAFDHTSQSTEKSLEIIAFPVGLIFVAVVSLMLILVLVVFLQIKVWKYGLYAGNLRISYGLIHRKNISIPLAKITEIYTEEDFVDRLLSLCNLHILTPGNESSIVTKIEGLSAIAGQALEEELEALSLEQRREEALGQTAHHRKIENLEN